MKEDQVLEKNQNLHVKRRRKLLPKWIKIFCWIFMFFGIIATACLFLGFTNIKPELSFYGFETNEPFSIYGIGIIGIAIFKGITAYTLWFEKNTAIKLGKIDSIVGIIICAIAMFVLPFLSDGIHIQIRLELALLIPFLIKLNKIEEEWETLKG